MDFEFATASRIIFGTGTLSKLESILPNYGRDCLILLGKSQPDPEPLFSICTKLGIKWTTFRIEREPDIKIIDEAIKTGRAENASFVIGFGGGSVIDAGKATAALLTNTGELLDYLEVVGKGQALRNPSKPYIAIPTTAGTGSEVTRNAVVLVPDQRVKVSMRHQYLLPEVALVDPELTLGVPSHVIRG